MPSKIVLHNFIDGAAVEPADGRYVDLIDPSTGEVFASAPVSGEADVDRAMGAAAKAFEKWRDTTPRRGAAPPPCGSPRGRPGTGRASWWPPGRRTPASRSG